MTLRGYNDAELDALLKRAFDRYAAQPGKAKGIRRHHEPDPRSARRAYRRFEHSLQTNAHSNHTALKTLGALAACVLLTFACVLKLASTKRDDLVLDDGPATVNVRRNEGVTEQATDAPTSVDTPTSITKLPPEEGETGSSVPGATPTMTAKPTMTQTAAPTPSLIPTPLPTVTPEATSADIAELFMLTEPKPMEFYIENRVGTIYELYVYPADAGKGKARNTGVIKYGETFTVLLTAEECAKGGLWRISIPQQPGASEIYAYDSNSYTLSELLGRSFVFSSEVENWGKASVKYFFTEQTDETKTATIPDSFFRVVNNTGKNMTELYLWQNNELSANLLYGWLYDGQKCSVQLNAEYFASNIEVKLTVGLKATRGSFPWGWSENNRADMYTLMQTATMQSLSGHTVIFTLDADGQPEYSIE